MTDLILRAVARLSSLLFTGGGGRHRAVTVPPAPAPAVPQPPRHVALPAHRSPYAQEVAEKLPFTDTIDPVRPYVLASPRPRPDSPEERAQAERRWVLEMAIRGLDAGPAVIHGVRVLPGGRTVTVAAVA